MLAVRSHALLIGVLAAVLPVAEAAAPPPPFWGADPAYYVLVNMTNPRPVAYWPFNYYYNWTVQASRYEHMPPQYDEMCAGLPYGSEYQCNVIFATDGWSYLQFPKANYCCQCENSFGSTRYDWLQANSTFQGTATVDGEDCYHWTKQGQYLNHYYYAISTNMSVRFNEMWGTPPTLKQWDFIPGTYSTQPFDPALVEPPAACTQLCTSPVCIETRQPVARS